jgi:hypothetical protein
MRSSQQRPTATGGRRWPLIAVAILAAVGIVTAIVLNQERGGFETLIGRWLRPDGGYVSRSGLSMPAARSTRFTSTHARSISPKPKPRAMARSSMFSSSYVRLTIPAALTR